jgi:hypothetical protein
MIRPSVAPDTPVPKRRTPPIVTEILQDRLPVAAWTAPHTLRLPGTQPIAPSDWLLRDEAFASQMALRDRLIAERPGDVHATTGGPDAAAVELLDLVLAHLAADPCYTREAGAVRRPDGVRVPLDGPPLLVAGRLVQEDFAVHERAEGEPEHRLTGAILCFPSNWTLAEKLGRPLTGIHAPVERYDAGVAARVQRLFDHLRPEPPLMRSNLLFYAHDALYNPRPEYGRHAPAPAAARYLRVERQVLRRLPETGAVVFSIHTYLVRPEALTAEQRVRLEALHPGALAG